MVYLLVFFIVLLAYLAYILFLKPLRMRAYYSKVFKAQGYRTFQHPYQLTSVPFFMDFLKNQKQNNDYNYSGKHVYTDHDLIIGNIFNKIQLVFISQKLIRGFFDKDLQMSLPKTSMALKIVGFVVKRGLVFLEKNSWKSRRRLLSKIFNFDLINSQTPVMILTANRMFQTFEDEFWTTSPQLKAQRKIKLSLYSLISKYTSSIIIAGFLGLDLLQEKLRGKPIQQQLLRLADESVKMSRHFFNMIFGEHFMKLGLRKVDRQFLAYYHEINSVLKASIRKYREQSIDKKGSQPKGYKTIVQLIFQEIQREKLTQNLEEEITDDDLVDQIKTFVVAGTDTTSNYLTMLILYIYQHKEVLEKLRTEIAKVINCDEDITYENIKKIGYLECVLVQGSRMFGAAEGGFERILQQDALICDIPLKKGTCMNLYTRPLFSNPKIFKDPLSFKPERWEIQTQQNKRLLQLISFQFYGGPRGCIGKQLALTQAKIGVIKFLRRYKNLIEPGIQNRSFEIKLTGHIANSEVILQRYE